MSEDARVDHVNGMLVPDDFVTMLDDFRDAVQVQWESPGDEGATEQVEELHRHLTFYYRTAFDLAAKADQS